MTERELARFDLVHSHVEPFFVRLCSSVSARGVPWVHTYHTLYFPEDWGGTLAGWQEDINRTLLDEARHADARISVSRWMQMHLRREHGIETQYIPNGFDLAMCREADGRRFGAKFGTRPFALFVGAGDDIKQPWTFVRLARFFPEVDFVMIGDRLHRADLLRAADAAWPDNLRMLGRLPHADVLDAMAACKVLVMTSRSEGLPTVLMEAMALGKPVVGSDCPGVREVIGGDRFGYLYRRGDTEDLRSQFEQALEDTTRGPAARGRAEAEYAWSRVIRDLDGVYLELLA